MSRKRRDAGEVGALVALASLAAVTVLWWAFALWPLADGAAPVLERARAVCFGTDRSSGLPDATGWALLVGQPILIGSFLMVVWGETVKRALRGLAENEGGRIALAGAGTLGLVGLTLVAVRVAGAAGTEPAWAAEDFLDEAVEASIRPRLDRPPPPLELVDHRGEVFSLESVRGRPVLLTFAYGHCRTICPLVVRHAQAAAEAASSEAVVVVLTLDPWRDTPSRLPEIARGWRLDRDERWLLGGEPETVERTLDAWEVPRRRDPLTGEIVHPALTYVLTEDGMIAFASRGSVESLVALLERL